MYRNLIICLIVCFNSLFAFALIRNKPEKDLAEASKIDKSTQVSVVRVGTQNLEIFEEAVGTIEGVIDPTVAAEISARVIKVLVHPGQTVKKGETIALLDGSDFPSRRNIRRRNDSRENEESICSIRWHIRVVETNIGRIQYPSISLPCEKLISRSPSRFPHREVEGNDAPIRDAWLLVRYVLQLAMHRQD